MQVNQHLPGQGSDSSPFSSTIFVDDALIAAAADVNAPALATRTISRGC
jgi:hypothetical protein